MPGHRKAQRPCTSACVVVALAIAQAARAQPIVDNDYAVDLTVGPVMGSARAVGLAGAAAAIAEREDGIGFNPAAVANRTADARGRWDWDLGLSFLTTRGGDDIDNNGIAEEKRDLSGVTSVGGLLQFGHFGVGAHATVFEYVIEDGDGQVVSLDLTMARVAAGYGWFAGQVVAAGAVRVVSIELGSGGEDPLLEITSVAPDLGVLVRPAQRPFRVGVVLAGEVEADQTLPSPAPGERCVAVGELCLPSRVTAAWFGSAALAWRAFGPGAFNPAPVWDEDAKPHRGGRFLLVTGQLDVIGPHDEQDDAHAFQSFLRQEEQPAGRQAVFAPRLAAEAEVMPRRLRVRGGGYWEPSRFEGVSGRLHGAAGLDVRLFDFNLLGSHALQLSFAFDGAPRYVNAGLALGFWH